MKNIIVLLLAIVLVVVGVLMASDVDKRSANLDQPVFRYSAELTCPRDGTYDIQSQTINFNGVVSQICIRSTGDVNDPDITITIDDDLSNVLYNSGSIDTNTPYVFMNGDINDIYVSGEIIVNVSFSEGSLDANYPMVVNVDLYGK